MTHRALLAAAPLLALMLGCPPKEVVKPTPDEKPKEVATAAPAEQPKEPPKDVAPVAAEPEKVGAAPIYYAFDSAQLSEAATQTLQGLGEQLLRNKQVRISIQGNTCELGTTEYNLALGYRRAQAASDYLVQLGVDASRISVVSFGEERPAAEGGTEADRALNRRSEFAVQAAASR
jgi:peptidoglycan-associated lipoprotein